MTLYEQFFSSLQALLASAKEVEKLYEPSLAQRFNPLHFWFPDENGISKILAFFLDPNAQHSQGAVFLKAFMSKLGLDDHYSSGDVTVRCEKVIKYQRRIDIYVVFGKQGSFCLALENKPWAYDQTNQLLDYQQHLQEYYGDRYCLVYLTSGGAKPATDSIDGETLETLLASKKIKLMSYKDELIPLLEQWWLSCHSDRVRYFIKDFEQYLRQQVQGEANMYQQDLITNYILGNSKYLEVAFDVADSIEQVKAQLMDELKEQIQDIAFHNQYEVYVDANLGKQKTRLYFYKKDWNYYAIGFGFDKDFYEFYNGIVPQFKYSILSQQVPTSIPPEIFDAVIKACPDSAGKKVWDQWPWWQWDKHYKNWGTDSFVAIKTGDMKAHIITVLKEVEERLAGIPL